MSISKLIEEFKQMAIVCHNVDYGNKESVKRNNKAVDRMYQIIDNLRLDFGEEGVTEFKKLLFIKENKTNIWAAVQMLEKMNVDKNTKEIALSLIKEEAKLTVGFEYWLKNYNKKNPNT